MLRDAGHTLRLVKLQEGDEPPPHLDGVEGIVALGGALDVDEVREESFAGRAMDLIRQAHEQHIPVVGICLGAQMIAESLGGDIEPMGRRELGIHPLQLSDEGAADPLLSDLPRPFVQFHFHSEEVVRLPQEAVLLASSEVTRVQAFRVGSSTYAFQYHPGMRWEEISELVESRREHLQADGIDVQQLTQQVREQYDLYRRHGDRLVDKVVDGLFS